MRFLILSLLLALPSLAFAGPCPEGWNGPINAATNPGPNAADQASHDAGVQLPTERQLPKALYPH